MISLPQPGAVVDAMGVDPESLRAERDRVGRKLRLAKYAGLGAFGLIFLLQLSGVFGVFDLRSILPVFLGGVITLAIMITAAAAISGTNTRIEDAGQMAELAEAVETVVPMAPGAEFSVEIDPNEIDEARLDALAAAGMSRAGSSVMGTS